jgi:hypothetical protein
MTSLNKRLEYLGIADFDYLSARLLMLHGLVFTALPKAAEAFEKLLKLFLLLEAKIARNEELTPEQMKKFGHNLSALFKEFKVKVPASFGQDWDDYLGLLQESYTRRYPEHWGSFTIQTSFHQLDAFYCYLRNNISMNFPLEERARARQFGTFIFDAYSAAVRKVIENLGGRLPGDLLRQSNESFAAFDIDVGRL